MDRLISLEAAIEAVKASTLLNRYTKGVVQSLLREQPVIEPDPGNPNGLCNRKLATFSVYDRKDGDNPVIIGGTAQECADAMGITLPSFYSTHSRRKSGIVHRWEIYRDDSEDEEATA